VDADGLTKAQLVEAATALADWTTDNPAMWHPDWQPADIFPKSWADIPPGSSAQIFAEAFVEVFKDKASLRTLWGTLTDADHALALSLEPGQRVVEAWRGLAPVLPEAAREEFPLVIQEGGAASMSLTHMTTQQARRLFQMLAQAINQSELWQSYVQAVLGTVAQSFGGYGRASLIEEALREVPLDRPAHPSITIKVASESRFAVRLTDEWHECFRSMKHNWLDPNWTLAGLTVFGLPDAVAASDCDRDANGLG
jgi:hypothetical protein